MYLPTFILFLYATYWMHLTITVIITLLLIIAWIYVHIFENQFYELIYTNDEDISFIIL